MFLYNYNTPNNKPLVKTKNTSYCKVESNNADNIKEPRKPNFQTISPFYSQNQISYFQTEKVINNHLTTSIEASHLHNVFPKKKYLNLSLGKQSLNALNDHDIQQGNQNSSSNIFKEKDKDNARKGESIIYKYNSSFSQNNCQRRKVFSANNSLEGSCLNEKSGSSLKNELNFNSNNKENTITPTDTNNIIEGFRNQLKETDCLKNNLLSSHMSTPLDESQHLPSLKALNQLEEKLKKDFNSPKYNSKSKQYNFIKSIFEELILLYPIKHQVVMSELLSSYHRVVLSFSKENKTLKESNSSYQKRLSINEKNHCEVLSLLKWKEIELESFKKKQLEIKKNCLPFKKPSNLKSLCSEIKDNQDIESYAVGDNSKLNNYIVGLNKQNLEDLDGLYFPDKVPTGSNLVSNQIIPTLQLNHDVGSIKDELRQKRAKAIYANILNMLEREENENNQH